MVTPAFDAFLTAFKLALPEGGTADAELYALFEQHREEVGEHFEGTLAYMNKHCESPEELRDWFGAQFQKGFRQFDVVNDNSKGGTDVKIWQGIHASKLFWTVLLKEPEVAA